LVKSARKVSIRGQKRVEQRRVAVLRGLEADLRPEHGQPLRLEAVGEAVHGLGRRLDRGVPVLAHQRQKRRRELREVPHQDVGLAVVGVAAVLVDRGIDLRPTEL
jgi:hypothetical protein